MSKKYLYAVRIEDCEVTFLRPAVFTNKAAAEKFCDEMQRLCPDMTYTVLKFLPQS